LELKIEDVRNPEDKKIRPPATLVTMPKDALQIDHLLLSPASAGKAIRLNISLSLLRTLSPYCFSISVLFKLVVR
jgi:hypothetical protein